MRQLASPEVDPGMMRAGFGSQADTVLVLADESKQSGISYWRRINHDHGEGLGKDHNSTCPLLCPVCVFFPHLFVLHPCLLQRNGCQEQPMPSISGSRHSHTPWKPSRWGSCARDGQGRPPLAAPGPSALGCWHRSGCTTGCAPSACTPCLNLRSPLLPVDSQTRKEKTTPFGVTYLHEAR